MRTDASGKKPAGTALALTLVGAILAFAGCRRDARLPSETAPTPKVVPKAAPYPFPNKQPPPSRDTVVLVPATS